MAKTAQDLLDAIKAVRVCQVQVTFQRSVVKDAPLDSEALVVAKRQLAVKEIELELLRLRVDEIAERLI